MRFATKVDRIIVKSFIQKDKKITCPIKGDYYALIEDEKILSALCIVNCDEHYHVQGMRTEKENRHKGYSTELLRYAITQYQDKPIKADCLIYSKNIFLRLGFAQICEKKVGTHVEYVMTKEVNYGKAKT